MPAEFPKVKAIAIDFVEKMARIFIGEPARIVRKSTLDRLERLAYREELKQAEERGDTPFLNRELQRNQLTEAECERLSTHNTDISDWPEPEPDLLTDDDFVCHERSPEVKSSQAAVVH